jgi:hypothetical protein
VQTATMSRNVFLVNWQVRIARNYILCNMYIFTC